MNIESTTEPAGTSTVAGIGGGNPTGHPPPDTSAADAATLRAAIRESKFTPEQSAVARLLTEPPYGEDAAKRIEAALPT